MSMDERQRHIRALAGEKRALILAHFYQTMDIQEVADVVGDSFELARQARQATHPLIVLCGVRFMAESAKLLNPDKTVLLPAPDAGCPMADMVTPDDVTALRAKHPDAAFLCYVNSSAAVKAACDVCCTSSSAVRVARALPHREIVFLPDQNLGHFVAAQVPEKRFHLYDGYCIVHHLVRAEDVRAARRAHPECLVLVHPECPPAVVALADFAGSTAEILRYVERREADGFLIGTEVGVVERLRATAPDKRVFLLKPSLLCRNMKKTTLADLAHALETGREAVEIDAALAQSARRTLDRMIALSL
ncbi:MAG: quinolinate synthase NadA [Oscillospiraceae bacterium]|jgi:quinolinate synthase|nr:quinolinate synthase NadA [Oscillospiraceae bacterium]